MTKASEVLVRYRKPVIGVVLAIAIYSVLGFFAAPWLIKKTAVDYAAENLGTTLEIEKVSVNPYVLSLGIDGLALDTPEPEPFLRFDRFFVNFQLSSLFRWALTFREVHLDGLEVFIHRDDAGGFNLEFLAQPAPEPEEPAEADDAGPTRLLIHDFAIRDSVVRWSDDVPPEPVRTAFGPVNIVIDGLNTLPDRAGMQDVVITTETQGTLSWNGSLELNPLRSEGSASIRGSHFPLTSAYLKHDVGFDVTDGIADVDLDYRVDTLADGTIEFSINNFNLAFNDIIVRTFNQAVGRQGEDREVLRLSRIGLSGGEMHWPSRRASAVLFSIDSADVSLFRDQAGALNILPPAGEPAEPEPTTTDEPGEPWQITLDQFSVNQLALGLLDESVTPTADIGWESLDVDIRDISNAEGAAFPTTVELLGREGGTISTDGTITVLPAPDIDLNISIDALALASAQPYLDALADLNLDSGALNVTAQLQSSPDDAVRFAGDVEIVDFLITETDEGSRLGSWQSLEADNVVFSAAGNSLDVSEVRLTKPYGDILIAADGSINLGRARKGEPVEDETEDGDADAEKTDSPAGDPVAVTIGRVSIIEMAADFADLSLPLPFSAKIANMNGELSTISTASAEPSTVALEGQVDEFGQVRVDGALTPLDVARNTDVTVAFQNVEMPKFSAYSIPFAGREIASGKLDLDLGYKIENRKLAGENNIVLRDFELGDEVEHPGAMSLPLGLAVALLKDPEGKIDIDLPVEGDLDDPEFRIGGVVMQALGNLVVRIVTSPFALLANLVGAEADELDVIAFDPGRSDLSPPEAEKAMKIAEALLLRPELALQLGGVYAADADGAALRTAAVDEIVEARIAELGDDTMYAENRQSVIEALFRESGIATDPAAELAQLRASHTTPASDETAGGFDALAYTEALRDRLIEAHPLEDGALIRLATDRVNAAKQAIAGDNVALAARIVIDSTTADIELDDELVPMQVRLTSGKELGIQVPQDVGSGQAMTFQCGDDGPAISVTFVGPETVRLESGETAHILQQERSASGARYVADGLEFWNKGDDAMFTDGDNRYDCVRLVPQT